MSQHGGLGDTARRWRELHGGGGDGGWSGLLDPLDLDLRRTVLRYGEMAQAAYDAFNRERASPHAGLSRFARARFFDRVRLLAHAAAYRVTRFLYTTSSVAVPEAFILRSVSRSRRCRESNWIGDARAAAPPWPRRSARAAALPRPRGRACEQRESSRSATASPARESSSSAAASWGRANSRSATASPARASSRSARPRGHAPELRFRHGLAGAREQQLRRGAGMCAPPRTGSLLRPGTAAAAAR